MNRHLRMAFVKQIVAIVAITILAGCNGSADTNTDTTTKEFSGDRMNQDLKEAIEAGTLNDINVSEENQGGVVYSVTDVSCGSTTWRVSVPASNLTTIRHDANGNTKSFDQSNSAGDSVSLDCTKNGGQGSCVASGSGAASCTKQ